MVDDRVPFHAVADLFPALGEEDFAALVADIKVHGLREGIWIHEGQIIDGRHRYDACLEAGVEPWFREWDGEGSLLNFVVSMNLVRRHLSTSQRAAIAAEIRPQFEPGAKERQGARTDISANLRESEFAKSSEQAAALLNVSPRSVEAASKVKADGAPGLFQAVKEGSVKVSTAAAVADLPIEEQTETVAQGPAAIKRKARERRRKQAPDPETPPESADDSEDEAESDSDSDSDSDHQPRRPKLTALDGATTGIFNICTGIDRNGGVLALTEGWTAEQRRRAARSFASGRDRIDAYLSGTRTWVGISGATPAEIDALFGR